MSEVQPLQVAQPDLRDTAPTMQSGQAFTATLNKAISAVDQAQLNADSESEKIALGGGNLHEAALALDKADISMRLLMTARNKIVSAYQEVMKMSV